LKSRRWAFRILLAVFLPIAVVLAGEAVMRVALFSPIIRKHPCSPGWNHPQYLVMPDPDTNYSLRPYFQGRLVNDFGDFDVPVIVNALGMRDREVSVKVDHDRPRVLMLGDSNTFGEGVSYEQAYPALVEKILSERMGIKARVFDAGVPSDSLAQMEARLRRYAGVIRPQLVTVCWMPYAFGREEVNRVYLDGYLADPEKLKLLHVSGDNIFLSWYPPGSSRARADVWLQSHSFLYFFAKYRLWQRASWFQTDRVTSKLKLPTVYLVKPLETISRIAQLSRDSGARFILIALGPGTDFAADMEKYCRQKNLDVIMVEPGLYADPAYKSRFLFKHDWHLTAAGHEMVAEKITPPIAAALAAAQAGTGGAQ